MPSSWRYLETLRDAYLLRGLWPSLEADGRSTMAARDDRDDRGDAGLDARRAVPGPYPDAAQLVRSSGA